MPHATGEQLALVANTINPLTRLILLTGSADRYNDNPSGVHLVLSKPFTSAALLEVIVKVMGGRLQSAPPRGHQILKGGGNRKRKENPAAAGNTHLRRRVNARTS